MTTKAPIPAAMTWLAALSLVGCSPAETPRARDAEHQGSAPVLTENVVGEARTALVIGNAAYDRGPLRNPVNDADSMSEMLTETGFEVRTHTDVSQKEMKRAVRDFGRKIRGSGGVGLFFYAGHGMQVNGKNYLIPVDAKIESEEDVDIEAVTVNAVLAQMDAADNRLNIVVLDACRNNPFARAYRSSSRGLALMDAPQGTLIAYATAPGAVADDGDGTNGIFTAALLRHARTKGAGIEEVFKAARVDVRRATDSAQTPWESSSLTGHFYFVPDESARPTCPEGSEWDGAKCMGTRLVNETECPKNSRRDGSRCVRTRVVTEIVCPAGTTPVGGECVATVNRQCPGGMHFKDGTGCVPNGAPPPPPRTEVEREESCDRTTDPFCTPGADSGGHECNGFGLTGGQAQGVVNAHRREVSTSCLGFVKRGSAKVSAAVTVAPSGAVSSVSVTGGAEFSGLRECVSDSLRSWSFPKSHCPTRLSIPFTFIAQ